MALFKNLTFDGVSIKEYGAYITGEGVYNAPERDVEMITIPGRNGEFALDRGRFNNITVSYPAGSFANTQPNFAAKLSELRNILASRKGYKRIEDEYNPDEYRMGIYKSGLEVSPEHYGTAGQYNLVFDCKPQRFLKSGETAQTVTNGGAITNPTLFPARPLLAVTGYGSIHINGYDIEIQNETVGPIALTRSITTVGQTGSQSYEDGALNNGDPIVMNEDAGATVSIPTPAGYGFVTNQTNVTSQDTNATVTHNIQTSSKNQTLRINVKFPLLSFVAGTDKTVTNTASVVVRYTNGTTEKTGTGTLTTKVIYTASTRTFKVEVSLSAAVTGQKITYTVNQKATTGDSSVSILGNPSYIDCEIGEAYFIKNGSVVPINNYVSIGSRLPELAPGANTITFDNTITQLKITPRWWKI